MQYGCWVAECSVRALGSESFGPGFCGWPATAAREKGRDRDGGWVHGLGSRGGKGKNEAGGTGKEAPARKVDTGEERAGTIGQGESGGRPKWGAGI